MSVNRVACLLVALSFLVAGCEAALTRRVHASLRYDGVYKSVAPSLSAEDAEDNQDFWNYLRFYPDGTVIVGDFQEQPEELPTWFIKGTREYTISTSEIGQGTVTVQGTHVSFSTVSRWGTVDYSGEIDGNQIHLQWYSHINHTEGSEVYLFVGAEHDAPADKSNPRR